MKKTQTRDTGVSKYHVNNLERALKILELFSTNPEGLTTTQITEKLRIPRNSVFRITATLYDYGYLTRDNETKRFQLSPKLWIIAHSALSEQNLVEKSIPVMHSLRDKYGETVALGILRGQEGMVIEEISGTHPFRFVLEPGKRFSIHSSAPGKAILAFISGSERENIIEALDFTRFNERTITSKKAFRNCLEEVRKSGYAIDEAEGTEGMHCVGAPIFNHKGEPIAAIWIAGPSMRITKKDFKPIGAVVKMHADQISRSYGYLG
jgi:DNA-binding IclR family transcriptional regulator